MKASSASVTSGSRFKLGCSIPDNSDEIHVEWLIPPNEVYSDKELYYQNHQVSMLLCLSMCFIYYHDHLVKVLPLWHRTLQYQENNQWVVEVRNASYLDTGLYTCINKTNRHPLSRHYVFVKGIAPG